MPWPPGTMMLEGHAVVARRETREQRLAAKGRAGPVFIGQHIGTLDRPTTGTGVSQIAALKSRRFETRIGRIGPWRDKELVAQRSVPAVSPVLHIRFVERAQRIGSQRFVLIGARWNLRNAEAALGVVGRDDARTGRGDGIEVGTAHDPAAVGKIPFGVRRDAVIPTRPD